MEVSKEIVIKKQRIGKSENLNVIIHNKKSIIRKIIFFFILLMLILLKKQKLELIKNKILSIFPEHKYKYFSCFCGIARNENLYARELIEHYISLGVEKFYLGDHNLEDTEKLYDVLNDFVDEGIVEIIDLIGKSNYNNRQTDFYAYVYGKHNFECKWMLFLDFDEFLFFSDKNTTKLKQFLSNEKFEKCDSIKINWLIYDDNDLVYYDDRPVVERFTRPLYNNPHNIFVKSIVRGGIIEPIWIINGSPHTPNRYKGNCDSLGVRHKRNTYISNYNYTISYKRHYTTKTIEEFAYKTKRGYCYGKVNYTKRLNHFFYINKYTKEKVAVYKRILNISDSKY